jgi:nucleotide-binding universal stress UspA family protein
MLFKTILLPLDGSLLSETALDPALLLAKATKGELLLLSTFSGQEMVDPTVYGLETVTTPVDLTPLRERLTSYLDSLRSSRAGAGVPMRTVVMEGDAAGCVVETAVTEKANLIVMSTHGRSGASRLFLGSVTESVLRRATCPVLAVRGQPAFRNILVTVNQTTLSEQALDPGFSIASSFGAQVHLLMVSPDAPVNPESAAEWDEMADKQRGEEAFQHEEAYLEDLRDRYQMAQPVITAVRGGKRESAILSYADVHKIDLIIMASRRHTGLKRWVFGSVSEKVLRHAPCSVMVIPPQPQVGGW